MLKRFHTLHGGVSPDLLQLGLSASSVVCFVRNMLTIAATAKQRCPVRYCAIYMGNLMHRYVRLDGSTNRVQRMIDINRFNRPGSDLFIYILNTRAGAPPP